MNNLNGKVAIVTGASRGIGRSIARRLASDGAAVVVNFRSSASEARTLTEEIEGFGGTAWAVKADISRVDELRRLFDESRNLAGDLDIVVANAGIYWRQDLMSVTADDFDNMFAVNARGVFFTLQEAAKRVVDGGRIINISTGATAIQAPAEIGLYCASKVPAEQVAKILARSLGPRGICVNTVSPGFTDTDMLPTEPGFREQASSMSPFNRIGRPQDIAGVVAFLASEEASWITGQNIHASGGIV